MSCCSSSSSDNDNKQNIDSGNVVSDNVHKGHLSHILMMAICCGAPMLILLLLSVLGNGLPALKGVMLSIAPFICPLMMIFIMVPMMFKKHNCRTKAGNRIDSKQADENKVSKQG